MTQTPAIDEAALDAFVGQAVSDAGAAVSVLLSHIGDRLGLYAALADGQPSTPAALAARTGTNERMVQEWLYNQASGGYVSYDPDTATFRLPPEHAFALADESSPALVNGLFDIVAALYQSIDKETAAFRTGTGLAWGDHHPMLFPATERSFRPGYRQCLLTQWIPTLDGVHDKLVAGARVADVGCGYGTPTVMLAEAYPRSTFDGYDYHADSIRAARKAASDAGVAERVRFHVADATELAGPYELIAFFDCFHDTADPLAVASAARAALAPGGSVLVVEPFAAERAEDNFTPLGRFGYGTSALACTPCSLSGGGPGLGAQAGESRIRAVFDEAGFAGFRRTCETPLNVVYEARG